MKYKAVQDRSNPGFYSIGTSHPFYGDIPLKDGMQASMKGLKLSCSGFLEVEPFEDRRTKEFSCLIACTKSPGFLCPCKARRWMV
jgi:hypothetical protein